MTDDHTRHMFFGDHAESRLAASGEHEHTYPRDEQPFDVDGLVAGMVASAGRLRRWAAVAVLILCPLVTVLWVVL